MGGTTGWGADNPVRWEAPRLAYELIAEYAGSVCNCATLPSIGKRWDDIPVREQRGVLTALACQMRIARHMAQQQVPARAAVVSMLAGAPGLCQHAAAVLAMLADGDAAAWAMPACSGCRRGIAGMLCALQYSYYAVLGFSAEMIIAQAERCAGN